MTSFLDLPFADIEREIIAVGTVDAHKAGALRERLFADGKIDREEADFLFRVNDAVAGKANDPAWRSLFIQAMTQHVLADETSPGELDEAEWNYLKGKIDNDGKVDAVERDLLVNIAKKAKKTPGSFQDYVLATLKASILDDGIIDEAEVSMLITVVFGQGGSGGAKVDRKEADFLFELNDELSGKQNHASWRTFFCDAICNHLLEDETSPDVLDEMEATWLISKIQKDGKVDDIELSLLVAICERAKEAPPSFHTFVLETLKSSVLEDGVIDENEVNAIKAAIYGEGGADGSGVSRKEADFLFALNDAVSGKKNHASWQKLFVEAISKHVLEDETSPGIIDEQEAAWLVAKISGDGKLDTAEKALFENISTKAKSMPSDLADKIASLKLMQA